MRTIIHRTRRTFVEQYSGIVIWWLLLGVAIFYSAYALYMGGVEVASRLGWVAEAPERSVSGVFVVHAFSGAIVLTSGILQFNRLLLTKWRALHRNLGKLYVVMVWLASIGGVWLTLFFAVTLVSKLIFTTLALLWFGTTTLAFIKARQRKIAQHREWMIRSYALSFFFVTFSFWVEGLAAIFPANFGYPLAVFLSWSLNLLVVENWIRRSRPASQGA